MTDINYTHITLVVDRSGSMNLIRVNAQIGVNEFIAEQAKVANDFAQARCTLTLVQFDNEYDIVHDFETITPSNYPAYQLVPRNDTALLDAMGRAAVVTGERLAALPEDQRPGQVYFVVMTDGQENASKEWTKQQIVDLLHENTTKYGWQVMYLSAAESALADARAYGVPAASTMVVGNVANYGASSMANSHAVARGRRSTYAGGQSVAAEYTEDEQEAAARKEP